MSGYSRNGARAGALAFALLCGGAAQAQELRGQPMQPPPEGAAITGVTVSVPKVVERTRYGVTSAEVFMSVRVPYHDLDMASPTGVAELDRRVAAAGDYVCEQLERMYPTGTPEEFYCVKRAVDGARPQVIKARGGS